MPVQREESHCRRFVHFRRPHRRLRHRVRPGLLARQELLDQGYIKLAIVDGKDTAALRRTPSSPTQPRPDLKQPYTPLPLSRYSTLINIEPKVYVLRDLREAGLLNDLYYIRLLMLTFIIKFKCETIIMLSCYISNLVEGFMEFLPQAVRNTNCHNFLA